MDWVSCCVVVYTVFIDSVASVVNVQLLCGQRRRLTGSCLTAKTLVAGILCY